MKTIKLFLLLILPAFVFSQSIVVEESVSNTNFPEITWRTTGMPDTTAFNIFRADVKNKTFHEIHTIHYTEYGDVSDTVRFVVVDTTLTVKGLYVYYITIRKNDKEVKSETAMGHNFGLIPIPQLVSFTATPVEDRKAIRLDWKLNYNQTVSSMSLYRSMTFDSGYVKVTDLGPDMTTYTDVAPKANEPLFYFIVIHDYFGGQRPSYRIPAFATFAEKPVRPQNIHGSFKNDTIVITWKNAGENIIGYRVYRSLGTNDFLLLHDMQANVEEGASFIDSSAILKHVTKVRYYVRNVSDGFVESNSSDTLDFYIPQHEKVLPPAELDYVTEANGDIKLLWVPSKEGLTLSYNVFIKQPDGKETKLNTVTWEQNYFLDTTYRTAGKYVYEVESVGFRGSLSERRTSVVVIFYPVKIHVIVDLRKQKNGIQISWKKPLNERITKLMLYKKYGRDDAVLKKSFSPTDDVTYLDTKVTRGVSYLYSLVALMENGDKVVVNDGVEILW